MTKIRRFSITRLFSRRNRRQRSARHRRSFQPLFETLEERQLLAYGVALSGAGATFTGDAAADVLTLSVDGSGNLMHNLPISGNLVSAIDLDSTAPGEQASLVSALTGLTVDDAANSNDVVTMEGANPFNFTLNAGVSITAEIIIVEQNLATGAGYVALNAHERIIIHDTGGIATTTGAITLMANQSASPVTGGFTGITHGGSMSTVDGDILLRGRSGDAVFGGSATTGVQTLIGSSIMSTGTGAGAGTITLDGDGFRRGVNVRGDVSSIDGDIAVSGIAQRDEGVQIDGGGTIESLGTGANAATITIDGTLDALVATRDGVRIIELGSIVRSVDGNIDITGNSVAEAGVNVASSAVVESTGAANITLMGQGAAHGVVVIDDSQIDTTSSGNILLTGIGDAVDGVLLQDGATINSIGTGPTAGTITINGTGNGSAGSTSDGVDIKSVDTGVHSADGDIDITGNTGAQAGVFVTTSAVVESTGTADITLMGTGGEYGLLIGVDSQINTTVSGNVLLTGIGDTLNGMLLYNGATINSTGTGPTAGTITINGTGNGAADGVEFRAAGTGVHSADGDISITTDTMKADATIASAGVLTIQPMTASTTIGLGGGVGTLNLTDAELALLADGFSSITIGVTSAAIATRGDVNIDSAVFTDPVTLAGNAIHDHAGTDIDAGTNIVTLDGIVSPGQSPGILAVSGNLAFADGDTYTVEIGGTAPGTANTNHDQIDATGSVTIGSNVSLNLMDFNSFGATITGGETFEIVNRTGGTGTFDGLAEGATISNFLGSGFDATISYVADDGDDVVLSVLEPSVLAETEVTLAAGELTITDVNGAVSNDDLTIVLINGGADLQISDPNNAVAAGAGVTQLDPHTVTVAASSVTAGAVFDLLGGDDRLTVDISGGDPIAAVGAGGITLNGGDGGNDDLVLTGGSVTDTVYNFENSNDGSVDLDGSLITYTGLEPITQEITATNVTLNYSDVGETITVTETPGLVWTAAFQDAIYMANLDGSNSSILVDLGDAPQSSAGASYSPNGIDIDTDFIYWADSSQNSIFRSNVDGSDPLVLVDQLDIPFSSKGSTTRSPGGISANGSIVYWADFNQDAIYRAGLDGSNPQVLVDTADIPLASAGTGSINPFGLAATDSFVYWADFEQDSIYRANVDGSNPQVLIDAADIPLASGDPRILPQGIAVSAEFVYWADGDQDSIYRANLDGSNPHVLVDAADIPFPPDAVSMHLSPRGLALDDAFLYWTDGNQQAVYRALLDGTMPEIVVGADDPPRNNGSFYSPGHIAALAEETNTVVRSTAGEKVDFPAPTGILTINAGETGDDIIDIVNLAKNYPAEIVIDGQGGNDVINILGDLSTTDRDMTFTAETVTTRAGHVATTTGNASVTFDGHLIPGGAAPSQLTVDGDLSLSEVTVNLDGHGGPGIDADQLRVTGASRTVDLTGAALTASLNFTPLIGEEIVIIDLVDAGSSFLGTFASLAEGDTLTLGGVDLTVSYLGGDGNDFSLTYVGQFPAKTPIEPLGSLIYDPVVDGNLSVPGGSVDYEIAVDAGQTITVIVTSAGSLQPIIDVRDPVGSSVGGDTAVADVALAQTASAATAGIYSVSVSGAGGTTGLYTVQILLNAAAENESHGGDANDTIATAQDINASFLNLGQPNVERAAVVGSAPQGTLYTVQRHDNLFRTIDVSGATLNSIPLSPPAEFDGEDEDEESVDKAQGLAWDSATSTLYGLISLDFAGSGWLVTVDPATGETTTVGNVDDGEDARRFGEIEFDGSGNLYGITGGGGKNDDPSTLFLIDKENPFSQTELFTFSTMGAGGLAFNPDDGLLYRYKDSKFDSIDVSTFPVTVTDIPLSGAFPAFTVQSMTYLGNSEFLVYSGGGGPPELYTINTSGVSAQTGLLDHDNVAHGMARVGENDPQDVYAFDLSDGDVVTLALTGAGTVGLLDGGGSTLAVGLASATNVGSVVSQFTVTSADTYYASVTQGGGDYSLVVTRNAAFDLEDNNDVGTAQDLGDTQGVLGHLGADGADYFRFEVTSPGETINLSTQTPADGPGEFVNDFDPLLELFDPTGASVATDDNSGPDGRNAVIGHTAAMTGTYTLLVTGANSTSGEYVLSKAIAAPSELDFGDAPDMYQSGFANDYPVTEAEDGARHVPDGPTLGPARDAEDDGVHSAAADADDTTGDTPDDEDGVVFGTVTAGVTGEVSVDVQGGTGRVVIWVDFNQDGIWDNATEKVHDADLTATTHQLTFPVPPTAQLGTTFARVRIASDPADVADPTGEASDGEVEDYPLEIETLPDRIGAHRDNFFELDLNGNGVSDGVAGGDVVFQFGLPGDIPLAGDFNGDGTDEIGYYRSSARAFALDLNGNGIWDGAAGGDLFYQFGQVGDTPLVGDWDGDGTDEIGAHRDNAFELDLNGNGTWDGTAGGDASYQFGQSGDTPITGDWDGDATDEIGFHRNQFFALDLNGNGIWEGAAGGDALHGFGLSGDTPLSGDFNGDGTDEIGFHRDQFFALDLNGNGIWEGTAGGDAIYGFGLPGDTPISGDWNADGTDEIGFYRSAARVFSLDLNGNGVWEGVAGGDALYGFGQSGDTPIVGKWATAPTLLAAGGVAQTGAVAPPLTRDELAPVLQQAIDVWSQVPLSTQQQRALSQVNVHIADLPGARLGQAAGTTITIDVNAAGYGWFVDPTPGDDEEFTLFAGSEYRANRQSEIGNRQSLDLLTAVLHEMGHVLGYDHEAEGVMQEQLPAGTRLAIVDAVFQDETF